MKFFPLLFGSVMLFGTLIAAKMGQWSAQQIEWPDMRKYIGDPEYTEVLEIIREEPSYWSAFWRIRRIEDRDERREMMEQYHTVLGSRPVWSYLF